MQSPCGPLEQHRDKQSSLKGHFAACRKRRALHVAACPGLRTRSWLWIVLVPQQASQQHSAHGLQQSQHVPHTICPWAVLLWSSTMIRMFVTVILVESMPCVSPTGRTDVFESEQQQHESEALLKI